MDAPSVDTLGEAMSETSSSLHSNCPLSGLLRVLQWQFETLVELKYGCRLCQQFNFNSADALLSHIHLSHIQEVDTGNVQCSQVEAQVDSQVEAEVDAPQINKQLEEINFIKDEMPVDDADVKIDVSDGTDMIYQEPYCDELEQTTSQRSSCTLKGKALKRKTRTRKDTKLKSSSLEESLTNEWSVKRRYVKRERGAVPCRVCALQFVSKSSLLKHFRSAHPGEKYFTCEVCGEPQDSKRQALQHAATHAQPKQHQCLYCEQTFPEASQLRAHREAHKRTGFQCPTCNHVFNRRDRLKDHLNIHTGSKPYSCNLCGKTFSTRNHSLTHKQSCGKVRSPRFTCEKCGKSFVLKVSLARHEMAHANIRPFKCEVCQKAYNDSTTLRRHSRIHTKDVYVCSMCGRHLRNDQTLRVHMATVHLGIKRFQCGYCGRAFAQKDVMQAHERVHTDAKPYKCTLCSAAFRNRATFHAHKKKHSPVLPCTV